MVVLGVFGPSIYARDKPDITPERVQRPSIPGGYDQLSSILADKLTQSACHNLKALKNIRHFMLPVLPAHAFCVPRFVHRVGGW